MNNEINNEQIKPISEPIEIDKKIKEDLPKSKPSKEQPIKLPDWSIEPPLVVNRSAK